MTARTIDEFRRLTPQREPNEAEVRHLRGLRQAEVSADRLTGDPDWDAFLSYIQAAIDSTLEQKRVLEDRLLAADVVEQSEIIKIKIALRECIARIEAWIAVMNLPADIKKNGKEAKHLMERLNIEAA